LKSTASMSGTEDDDLRALRASSWALIELQNRLPQFIETLGSRKAETLENKPLSSNLPEILDMVSHMLVITII